MRVLIIEQRVPSAGFFSDFSLITGSLEYLKRNNITDFYIFWNNYRYQDGNENLFDEYFFPQYNHQGSFDRVVRTLDIGTSMIGPIAKKETIKNFHDTLTFYNFFQNHNYKKCESECVYGKNTLGVHVRRTDHHIHGDLLPNEYYWSKIEESIDHYDNLFLATDDANVLSDFRSRYGNKLIYNPDVFRSQTNQAIHEINHPNKKKIVHDVIKDGISLSKCKELIFTASNVSSFALYLNPEIKYNQIDLHINHR